MSAFKYFTSMLTVVHFSLSREREGLLSDCRFGVKESESEDDLS